MKRRLTDRGLGAAMVASDDDFALDIEVVSDDAPPPSRVPAPRSGVSPSRPPPSRYTVHARRDTRRVPFSATVTESGTTEVRRGTRRMPACLDDMGPATAALAAGRARVTAVRRVGSAPSTTTTFVSDHIVLKLVDDERSMRSVIDASGLAENDALAALDRLARLGLIVLE